MDIFYHDKLIREPTETPRRGNKKPPCVGFLLEIPGVLSAIHCCEAAYAGILTWTSFNVLTVALCTHKNSRTTWTFNPDTATWHDFLLCFLCDLFHKIFARKILRTR